MNPLAWLNPGRWLLYLAAAVAAVVAYNLWANRQQEIGRKEVRAEWAADVLKQQADALARARDNAKETVRRIDRQTEAQNAHDQEIARARTDAAGAAAAADGLRRAVAAFAAASGRAPSDTSTSSEREATRAAFDLLTDMLGRVEEHGRGLAGYADAARAAGLQCERSYEALTK